MVTQPTSAGAMGISYSSSISPSAWVTVIESPKANGVPSAWAMV